MTNDPTTNQKSTRQQTTTSSMDDLMHLRQNKVNYSSLLTQKNLLQFNECLPIESSNVPHPRSGHRAVATDSDLWIWGGYYPSVQGQPERMFQELWRFNFALQRWTLERTTGDGPILTLASHSSKSKEIFSSSYRFSFHSVSLWKFIVGFRWYRLSFWSSCFQ